MSLRALRGAMPSEICDFDGKQAHRPPETMILQSRRNALAAAFACAAAMGQVVALAAKMLAWS